MKISKFIKKLQKMPQDLEVVAFLNPAYAWEYDKVSPSVKRINGTDMCVIKRKKK